LFLIMFLGGSYAQNMSHLLTDIYVKDCVYR
jgi:hypothetical protein